MNHENNQQEQGMEQYFFRASAEDFKKIPGSPIAYSASKEMLDLFEHGSLASCADARLGMATADNNLFLRHWFEVGVLNVNHNAGSRDEAKRSRKKWFPYQKGGDYRKWFGNLDYYVNWANDGEAIKSFKDISTGKVRSHNYNLGYIFKRGVTWNALTSSNTSARLSENSIFDNAGSSLFVKTKLPEEVFLGLLNSNIMLKVFPLISPTLNYQPGDIAKLPAYFPKKLVDRSKILISEMISISRLDWDSYESSWGFSNHPILKFKNDQKLLEDVCKSIREKLLNKILELQYLEQENNRIFIEVYGLQDELAPEVPLKEITLTCNPHYRYKGNKTEAELEALLLSDTLREFISYAVGCMFGRYSLDKEGLILANQGETLQEYLKQIPQPSFQPDDDNVLPLIDLELERGKQEDWFEDDISERFKIFLKVTFGSDHYAKNLRFIEEAIGKDIKKLFLKDFYSDHIKRYKKRPIYWLFSSPKGSFNALIYMHRYRPDTVSVVLNDYLREFATKLSARKESYEQTSISMDASPSDKTKALKAIEKITKVQQEIKDYEHDILYPLAGQNIEIDLDDGVKQNYPLFGKALKKVAGVS